MSDNNGMISDESVRVVEERLRFYTGSPGADWTAEAIAILEAAAPYMFAEWEERRKREAFESLRRIDEQLEATEAPSPYRSQA